LKILLRKSPEAGWQKLEPFEFGGPDGEKKLEQLLEKSPDLLTTEGAKPVRFFKGQAALGNNAADLLGVGADGMIVIIECKLDANREARRMVVGQIT
jgi:RecB family endonuclease NucS